MTFSLFSGLHMYSSHTHGHTNINTYTHEHTPTFSHTKKNCSCHDYIEKMTFYIYISDTKRQKIVFYKKK